MLNTAPNAGDIATTSADDLPRRGTAITAAGKNEVRPVRLLVPATRRSHLFLPQRDTLLASDLGITRLTTDDELSALVSQADAATMAVFQNLGIVEPLAYLTRLRNALAQPRDIAEAAAWGYKVPTNIHENREEYNPNPNLRLGWFWVYDLTRTETRDQRRERYLADMRLVDTKGLARLFCRRYTTLKGLKADTDRAREIVEDDDKRRRLARDMVKNNRGLTVERADELLLKDAWDVVFKGTPERADRAGQSDLFTVASGIQAGRDTGRLDEWYEFHQVKQTGRPPGSRTKKRKTTAPRRQVSAASAPVKVPSTVGKPQSALPKPVAPVIFRAGPANTTE